MNEINIARTILNNRKEKGLTQDELADFIGVSKASVSKWETGQSYPDIVLLPKLAAYFNISIDDLMGYEPQMTNDDIRKLYKELSVEFTVKPFDEVMDSCRDITKKYFSCFPLIFQIGVLYINYGYYTVASLNDEQKTAIVLEAKELFVRVKEQSDDAEFKQIALYMEALCELLLGQPKIVVDLLKDAKKYTASSNEVLLSQAYIMMGKMEEAKTELQGSIYDGIMGLFSYIPPYLAICADDVEHFEEMCRRTKELIKLFNMKEVYPTGILPFYLAAIQGYLANEKVEKALEMLEEYLAVVTSITYPLVLLKKDEFFKFVDVSTEELAFGTAELPRDEASIKQSMIDAIANNPALIALNENQRFQNIVRKLKDKLGGV